MAQRVINSTGQLGSVTGERVSSDDDEQCSVYETILMPTDGSESAERVHERVIDLATLFNADVHLLSVVDTEQFPVDADVDEIVDQLEERGNRTVTAIADDMRASGVDQVDTAVRRGSPGEEILAYVDEHEIELVTMGTRSASGRDSLHLGSIAQRVARQIEVPLLLL